VAGVAIRTKLLEESKKALFYLKISIPVSLVTYILALGKIFFGNLHLTALEKIFLHLINLGNYYVFVPVINLIGAKFALRIIEKSTFCQYFKL